MSYRTGIVISKNKILSVRYRGSGYSELSTGLPARKHRYRLTKYVFKVYGDRVFIILTIRHLVLKSSLDFSKNAGR